MNKLTVQKVESGEAKNGRKFQKVTFKEQSLNYGVWMKNNKKSRTRFLWEAFKDNKGREFQADGDYGDVKVGDEFNGSIIQVNTTPYQVEGQKEARTKLTVVVFEGENPYSIANSQLKSSRAVAVDETGIQTAEIPEGFQSKESVNP